MPHSSGPFLDPTQPHLMTCTVLHWIPVFTREETVRIALDGLAYLGGEGLEVYAYVVLDNHLQLIARSPNLDKTMWHFKRTTGRQILKYLADHDVRVMLDRFAFHRRAGQDERDVRFWQDSLHPELIINDAMMRDRIQAIHENPVKRGYVDLPEHWRFSSARDYAGQRGLMPITRWDWSHA